MSFSTSTVFSKDALLRPQVRFNRTRKNGTRPTLPPQILGTSTTNPLTIIPEEGLDSMPFPASTTRAQRRHALSSAAIALRTTLEDIAEEPVVFADIAFNFPLPPLPTSSSCSRPPYNSSSSTSSSPPSSPDSQSPGLPLTPSTSDDDLTQSFPSSNSKRTTIQPLVINKLHRPSTLPTIDHSDESDTEDSDSEWYTREFSKVLTLDSALPPISFPAAHRDSIFIAPAFDYSPTSPSSVSSERRRRRCSGLRYSLPDAPPVPPIPAQFLSPKCTKTLSITAPRRPPPRMSIPDDACSAFSLSLYTDDIASPAESSPLSIYSQDSACTSRIHQDFEDGDGVEDVEFPAGFEVQMDCPMMLPLSLPGTPIDLEADIAHGLEELRMMKENVEPQEGLGVGFILEEMDYEEEDEQQHVDIITPTIVCTSPPPSPLTILSPPSPTAMPIPPPPPSPASTISAFSFPPSPCTPGHELPAAGAGEHEDFDERRYGLKSKWSSSTLASVREEHAAAAAASSASSPSKFPGASKLKMYFQGQHKRNNVSISTPPSPKTSSAPTPTPTPTPIPVPALVSPLSVKGKVGKDKKEKRRSKRDNEDGSILVIGYNTYNSGDGFSPRRSHDSYLYSSSSSSPTNSPPPRRAAAVATPASPRRSHDLPPTPAPSPSRLSPTLRNFGLRRSPSQSSAGGVSECGSEGSCDSHHRNDPVAAAASSGTIGLRRKPIPVEMFLRNGV